MMPLNFWPIERDIQVLPARKQNGYRLGIIEGYYVSDIEELNELLHLYAEENAELRRVRDYFYGEASAQPMF